MKLNIVCAIVFLSGLLMVQGCGNSENEASVVPPVVKASSPKKVNVAALNRKLAANMTFSPAEELVALIKKGATPAAKNRYGLPVIFMAAERGELSVVKALIDAGADVNQTIGTSYNDDGVGYTGTVDGTPLCYAAKKGRVEVMVLLKQSGVDINGTGPEGTSPLMSAAESLQLESIEWLLANGSSTGKSKARDLAQRFINPDDKTKRIIQLLR